jgi:hypothetical protein
MSIIYTTQKSKRKPKKLNAAQRQLQAEWESLVKKYEPKTKVKPAPKQQLKDVYSLSTPAGRETPKLPSLNTGGYATKKESQKYTGTNMLGIGTLHKSNAVPVFCDNEAKEMARMRRG